MRKLFPLPPWPKRLLFLTEMARLTEGGLDYIKGWIEATTVTPERPPGGGSTASSATIFSSQYDTCRSGFSNRLHAEHLHVVADRGYLNSPEILACEQADIVLPRDCNRCRRMLASLAKQEGKANHTIRRDPLGSISRKSTLV
jgi:hypothetical protein